MKRTRGRRQAPRPMDWVVAFVQRIQLLVAAARHVETNGESSRRRARRKAAAPPRKCPTCKQPFPKSQEWRDYYDLDPHAHH